NEASYSLALAKACVYSGADALLIDMPYYSKQSQRGVYAHFAARANATDLTICVYEIPGRSGIPVETDTLLRMSEHPTVKAVKDAKGDFAAASRLIAETDQIGRASCRERV